MDRPSNMPRRAWQRRNLRRNRTADSSSSTEQASQRAGTAPERNRQPSFVQDRGDETDSSVGSTSDSEPEEEYGQSRRPTALYTTRAARPRRQDSSDISSDPTRPDSDSDSDSNLEPNGDSGYCSLEEDVDDRAEYYDDLLERFRREGPTVANHGKNTKAMETDQERIWNK
jgi:hypothetical protein